MGLRGTLNECINLPKDRMSMSRKRKALEGNGDIVHFSTVQGRTAKVPSAFENSAPSRKTTPNVKSNAGGCSKQHLRSPVYSYDHSSCEVDTSGLLILTPRNI